MSVSNIAPNIPHYRLEFYISLMPFEDFWLQNLYHNPGQETYQEL